MNSPAEITGASALEAVQPLKILVAEDAPNIRLGLTRMLQKWGYEVHAAADGEQAWEILKAQHIQFVVSDWMMPGISGPELCQKIRHREVPYYTYVILLTARDEKDALVEGMESGADDYLVKPFNQSELKVRIKAGERVLQLERDLAARNAELWEAHSELKTAYTLIEEDLKAAAQLQYSLLPAKGMRTDTLEFDWLFLPSTFVGGDILNYRELDEHETLFYMLDVSGHGVQAAMLSVGLTRVLSPSFCRENGRQDGGERTSPDAVVSALNDRFQTDPDDSRYFTMVLGIFDSRDGKIRICQAGHPHPILIRADRSVEQIGNGGMPVGMLPDVMFETSETDFNSGDRLIIYSDGITECEDRNEEQYGVERFSRFLATSRTENLKPVLEKLQSLVTDWQGSDQFDDDVSVLAIEHTA